MVSPGAARPRHLHSDATAKRIATFELRSIPK